MREEKEIGKADMGSKEAQREMPQLPKGRRYLYAGIFWFFAIGTLYTGLFVSWRGMLWPLIIAGILHHYLIKKNNVAIFPYQAQVTTWLYNTRFYDRFVRRVKVDKEARVTRYLGFWMLSIGLGILGIHYSSPPIVDLEDMAVVRGTYEGYIRLGRKNHCGSVILSIRLEDGTLAKYFETGAPVKELEKHKGMAVTIWASPTSKNFIMAECREFPRIAQIQSDVYQSLYNKRRAEAAMQFFFILGMFLTVVGFAFLLIVVLLPDKTINSQINSKQE